VHREEQGVAHAVINFAWLKAASDLITSVGQSNRPAKPVL